MRLSLLGASVAVAALALSACFSSTGSSTGSSVGMQSSGTQVLMVSHGHKLLIRPMHGVKVLASPECGTQYNFCFYVEKGNSGPYVETEDDTAPLYNVATIVKNKSGKAAAKFSNYFSPDPGDPTDQYIIYSGKAPKKPRAVNYTDLYCISFSEDGCANGSGSVLHLGIALY
jgi:hypothetical protein